MRLGISASDPSPSSGAGGADIRGEAMSFGGWKGEDMAADMVVSGEDACDGHTIVK